MCCCSELFLLSFWQGKGDEWVVLMVAYMPRSKSGIHPVSRNAARKKRRVASLVCFCFSCWAARLRIRLCGGDPESRWMEYPSRGLVPIQSDRRIVCRAGRETRSKPLINSKVAKLGNVDHELHGTAKGKVELTAATCESFRRFRETFQARGVFSKSR